MLEGEAEDFRFAPDHAGGAGGDGDGLRRDPVSYTHLDVYKRQDVNRDGSITMVEVDAAMKKRVDAALAASKTTSGRYALPPETSGLSGSTAGVNSPVLVDHDEARVFHGRQYYDSLAGDLAQDQMRGEPVPRNPAPDQFQKSF